MMSTINDNKPFGPDGCQVPVCNGVCGETRTLDIINEFKLLYEEKMRQIDSVGGGDFLEDKLKLQQDWIGNLSEQNEMLVRAVEDLEVEATERVKILEEKLQHSAQCICEVMKRYREYDVTNDLLAEPLQKIFSLESDQKNLLEFIRRVREENRWDINGLTFFDISYQQLFGLSNAENISNNTDIGSDGSKEQAKLKDREAQILEMIREIDFYKSFGNVECMAKDLKCKVEECESLKSSMEETRQVLTEEIASKHDTILQLKRDCQQIEERCIQADKQTAFRDDIIKELRKEIKQLKQQRCTILDNETTTLKEQALELRNNNGCLECALKEGKAQIEKLEHKFKLILKDKVDLKQRNKLNEKRSRDVHDLKTETARLNVDIENLSKINTLLENELKSVKGDLENQQSKDASGKVEDLTKENQKLMKELVQLNEENRNLLKTVDNHRRRIENTTKLTQDEIIRLTCTIDDLQTNLQQTRRLQEEEEMRNQAKVCKLSGAVSSLTENLKLAEEKYKRDVKVCKRCRSRSRVGFMENAEVQVSSDLEERQNQMETLTNKEEIIKVQNDTLNVMQQELHALKQQEFEVRQDRDCRCQEVQYLKEKMIELESALQDSDGKAANLQLAVDLYLNSINVLEASEEKYKIELNQQKSTISNLQKALVASKQELDELKQKSEDNEIQQHRLINCFNMILSDVEDKNENVSQQYAFISEEYGQLQDLNFDLEVDHCNSLQDVDHLENQLFKYQTLLKCSEEKFKNYEVHFRKLYMQKKCYEEVIIYFKEEMRLMAEQLCNLQELLTLSNQTTQEENYKLMQAFNHVQCLNETLTEQLSAAQQKAELENQMNQLQETKITELVQLISDRDFDLTRHDKAILNIRQSLQCSLKHNAELQGTIEELSSTFMTLQEAINRYGVDHSRSRDSTQECQTQITTCKEKLESLKDALNHKTASLRKLETDYTNQNRALVAAQEELREMRDRQKDKQCLMKCTIEELSEKLVRAEQNLSQLTEDFAHVQGQLASVSRKEAVKDNEVKQYRKIVCDLKNTLIDLNKSLLNRDMQDLQKFKNKCKNADCNKNVKHVDDLKNQDICLNCPCEVEFYQSIVETLKKAVIDLKKKLSDTQKRNQQLEEDGKRKEEQLTEYQDLRRKFSEKLKQAQAEEARYLDLAAQLEKELCSVKQDLEIKSTQLDEVTISAQEITSSRCVQLACAQEEVNNLKEKLNGLLRKKRTINSENEKLQSQSARMQSTIVALEEQSQYLKSQLEQYIAELQLVQNQKETLTRENRELLAELRSLQGSYSSSVKHERSVKSLESELHHLRNNGEEISSESRNVIGYVRGWLLEQKKINEHIVRRERNYCDTIQRLKQEYENLQGQYLQQTKMPRIMPPCIKPFVPPRMQSRGQSPWSLGSQGTASVRDADSPSPTPCPEDHCDWYSPSFRKDSEDEDEEDWVSKVENLAKQVRKTNKMWKNKMGQPDYTVSKDTKK